MEILRTYEYDIALVRGGHLEGPHHNEAQEVGEV